MNENLNQQRLNSQMSHQQQSKLYGASGKVAPDDLDALRSELEKLVDSDLTTKPVMDAHSFLAEARTVLGQVQHQLIRLDALHQARRHREMVLSRNRIVQMDRDHAKAVEELTTIMHKLEALS